MISQKDFRKTKAYSDACRHWEREMLKVQIESYAKYAKMLSAREQDRAVL